MKRCPECDFLYEDEQECCDMDGTVLRFTSFLQPSAAPAPNAREDQKSVWSGLTISLLTLIVIGSVLVTLYRATPPKFSSSSALQNQPAGTNQDTKLPVSESPRLVKTPATTVKATDPFAMPATRTHNAAANSPSSSEKRLTSEPADRDPFASPSLVVNAPKAAPSQTSPPVASTPKAITRPTTISVHPAPLLAKPAPQSKTQNQDKDSKFKSVFKKAGRVFKRPF